MAGLTILQTTLGKRIKQCCLGGIRGVLMDHISLKRGFV